MIDMTFVVETVRRRWVILLVALVVALGAGVLYSASKSDRSIVQTTYTAELTFYVDGQESAEVQEFNYSLNEDYLISDCKRIVLSDAVSGQVRRQFGEDVVITTPYWVNRETKGNIYSHFFYVDVESPSRETVLAAAEELAQLAVPAIEAQLPVSQFSLYEGPVLKNTVGAAADFGYDKLEAEPVVAAASSISMKTVVVVGFCGFAVAFVLVLMFDFFNQRIRTEHDVTRILGVPVLGSVPYGEIADEDALSRTALALGSRLEQESLQDVSFCGLCSKEYAGKVDEGMRRLLPQCAFGPVFDLSSSGKEIFGLESVPCVVLVVVQNLAAKKQIEKAAKLLNDANIPTLGAVYVTKNGK